MRAAGIEPAQALRPYGFSYHFGFHRRREGVRGLDYPFTMARERGRCCPSSLYTFFPKGSLARDCHLKGFPEFEQFCIRGFPRSTQSLKSVASTSFATPALVTTSDT